LIIFRGKKEKIRMAPTYFMFMTKREKDFAKSYHPMYSYKQYSFLTAERIKEIERSDYKFNMALFDTACNEKDFVKNYNLQKWVNYVNRLLIMHDFLFSVIGREEYFVLEKRFDSCVGEVFKSLKRHEHRLWDETKRKLTTIASR
jgi:hypothetical protein